MRQILVLGAGQSSPYLISHLLDRAAEKEWFVTVGDIDRDLARARVGGHPRGNGIAFDVNDSEQRRNYVAKADIVVSLLTPAFHSLVAMDCVAAGTHMVTASYRDQRMKDLEKDATRKNILILCEMGMDPGLDHMSAMRLIAQVEGEGKTIRGFRSYGSGLPAPDADSGPFRYAITWNPRNVVLAAQYGAQYMQDQKIKVVPYHEVFAHTWDVEVDGVGTLEAYPNRDSLSYRDTFGIQNVETMIRGTLRYPGWSETWNTLVRLGLTNDTLPIPEVETRSYRDVLEMFLPLGSEEPQLEHRVARALQISPTGHLMEKLKWLGLFSDELVQSRGATAADIMTGLLARKLPLGPKDRDMVILQHELDLEAEDGSRSRLVSRLLEFGEPGGKTAMSKTVGLPAAMAVEMILDGELPLSGCRLPTHPAIYEPALQRLEPLGLSFKEQLVELPS